MMGLDGRVTELEVRLQNMEARVDALTAGCRQDAATEASAAQPPALPDASNVVVIRCSSAAHASLLQSVLSVLLDKFYTDDVEIVLPE